VAQWISCRSHSWSTSRQKAGEKAAISELLLALESGERKTIPASVGVAGSAAQRKEIDGTGCYISEAPVNWCRLGTVLANEEVTTDGRSERGTSRSSNEPSSG